MNARIWKKKLSPLKCIGTFFIIVWNSTQTTFPIKASGNYSMRTSCYWNQWKKLILLTCIHILKWGRNLNVWLVLYPQKNLKFSLSYLGAWTLPPLSWLDGCEGWQKPKAQRCVALSGTLCTNGTSLPSHHLLFYSPRKYSGSEQGHINSMGSLTV